MTAPIGSISPYSHHACVRDTSNENNRVVCAIFRALRHNMNHRTLGLFGVLGFNASATARVISRRWNDDDEIGFLVEETGVPGGNHRTTGRKQSIEHMGAGDMHHLRMEDTMVSSGTPLPIWKSRGGGGQPRCVWPLTFLGCHQKGGGGGGMSPTALWQWLQWSRLYLYTSAMI